jgi:hypothetical protein
MSGVGNRALEPSSSKTYMNYIREGLRPYSPQGLLVCFIIRGRSQTTFTRQGRWVVQKCPLFVDVYTIENVNAGG